MSELLTGRQSVREALRANRRHVYRLWVEGESPPTRRGGIVAEIVDLARERGVPLRMVRGGLFQKLTDRRVNHQGVALETQGYPYVDLDDLLAQAKQPPFLLLLDRLQDVQNLGALIRTAEAVAVDGVVLPARRAAGVTPAVSNASAGAVEHLAVARVTNLNRAIDALKKQGIWVVGLDTSPRAILPEQVDFTGPLALVVGSEGPGLSRLTRTKCDYLVRLPMAGQVESLNAAVAGSIVLYHAFRQRRADVENKIEE